jgi:hypothetical protein
MTDRAPERSEEDREFDAISEQAIWSEAKDRLKVSEEAEAGNRKRAKTAILFREGVDGAQWDDSQTAEVETDVEITVNLTDALVARVENNIRQQRPRGKCHPVGEGADIEIAEILNGIGRHVETRSEASVAYDSSSNQAVTSGWGYFRLIAEYVNPRSFQKDLRILAIRNQFSVNMDPSAQMPHGGDQMWCLISSKMKRIEYKRRYPTAQPAAWTPGDKDSRMDWEDDEDIRLAEYFRIREKPEKLYQLRQADGSEFTKFRTELPRDQGGKLIPLEMLPELFMARGMFFDPSASRDSVKRQVEWFRLNGLKVVERQQIPGTYIPVFRVEGNATDIDGKVIRRGMVESMMDPARMVNYGETAKIKRLGLTPLTPWIAAEGQLDGHPEWTDANQKSYTALTYKPVVIETSAGPVMPPPPSRQPPTQIEQGFSEFVQGMRSNLMSVAGMPNEPGQDKQGEVVSGRALKRRQFLSDQSHFQYYDKLTLAIAQCWRVMVEWIPVYFSEERMQRVIGEDSTPQMVKINEKTNELGDDGKALNKIKNDLSVGIYDVVMDTGPGYETKREEGAESLIDLLKIQPLAEVIVKTGPDLVMRSIDHPYMQELADRLMAATPEGLEKVMEGLSSQAKSLVKYLNSENDALKKKLQEVEADLKYGITKAHLAATVKAHDVEESNATKRADTLTRAQTSVHDTNTRAHTALSVEEIRAGGTMLNTHVEAMHHRAEAEQMIKTAETAEEK